MWYSQHNIVHNEKMWEVLSIDTALKEPAKRLTGNILCNFL